MALFELAAAGDALEDLFDRERKAILAGQFDVLERLGAEKERLFGAVQRKGPGRAPLERLRHMADRNKTLLNAMEMGVRAASDRIEALRAKPGALQTYDAAGQRQPIDQPSRALHRRA